MGLSVHFGPFCVLPDHRGLLEDIPLDVVHGGVEAATGTQLASAVGRGGEGPRVAVERLVAGEDGVGVDGLPKPHIMLVGGLGSQDVEEGVGLARGQEDTQDQRICRSC